MPPEKHIDRLEMYIMIDNGMSSKSSSSSRNDGDNHNFEVSSVPCTYLIIEHGLLSQVQIFQSVVHELTRICPHLDQIKTLTSDWTNLKLFDFKYMAFSPLVTIMSLHQCLM
jgi:hypothetical protein